MIQLPRKNLDSWITFSPMSLRQYHSFFHRLIVAKLWFHFVVKCFHFVSLFQFLLVTNVNYQKSKALGPKNYLQNKIKKLQRQLKQGNKQRANNLSVSLSERKSLASKFSSSLFHTFTATSTDSSFPRIFNVPRWTVVNERRNFIGSQF